MIRRRFDWQGGAPTAGAIRAWVSTAAPRVDVAGFEREVREGGDDALRRLTARFDATESDSVALRVDPAAPSEALAELDAGIRESLELAAENVRVVAEAQIDSKPSAVSLPQGQVVTLREVPVAAAGLYAPGGRAAYPSTVAMCAIPARVAGVERLALASPPDPQGKVNPMVLAAAALCGIDEIYAVGGAQAVFALAYGTETIAAVDVVVGPGNAWVREAKRAVCGAVGIDSLAGPSELMVVAGSGVDPDWAALDLCAQAEHGADGPLIAVAEDESLLEEIADAAERVAARDGSVADEAPLALVRVPGLSEAVDLANAFAPEHLELLGEDAASLSSQVRTAGCVFAGRHAATAFGDYVAGSNHVLPTGGAGRFSGPLGVGAFRRTVATVEVSEEAASALAPHVDTLARAEGFPVHAESAMIRAGKSQRGRS